MKLSQSLGLAALAAILGLAAVHGPARADTAILNASFDPTRELYNNFDTAFAEHWGETTGEQVTVNLSNGGSGAQARAVIDGLEADVVTLALAGDIDAIAAKAHLLPANWQTRLPDNSTPYTSTIVFLVRKGNPKGIHDWGDLIKPGVAVITPNPKTSGGARWNFLAAWSWALKQNGGDAAKAQAFVADLYTHVPVLDSGARGSTITFTKRHQGDVLITWESDALLATHKLAPGEFQLIVPSVSILAEPSVSIVDANVDKHGTRKVAEAYLEYLYSEEGQAIIANNFFRPRNQALLNLHSGTFPKLGVLTTIADFGGWGVAQPKYFGDGGVFDQIYKAK
jgi:sulfate transport system substrate-binding protein